MDIVIVEVAVSVMLGHILEVWLDVLMVVGVIVGGDIRVVV